jgi:hypothetical protein
MSGQEEVHMRNATGWKSGIPKRRQQHHSYNDNADESERLIEDEPVEIEKEVPAEESEPMERIDENNTADSPAFEE